MFCRFCGEVRVGGRRGVVLWSYFARWVGLASRHQVLVKGVVWLAPGRRSGSGGHLRPSAPCWLRLCCSSGVLAIAVVEWASSTFLDAMAAVMVVVGLRAERDSWACCCVRLLAGDWGLCLPSCFFRCRWSLGCECRLRWRGGTFWLRSLRVICCGVSGEVSSPSIRVELAVGGVSRPVCLYWVPEALLFPALESVGWRRYQVLVG
ncbi:ABC-2 type transporter family protein [Striga asiatica]|uniref:ABC-2 type transporter family protein n=1 Tax=Striga asiatica TaxID=4170 RepID=A0A5A7QF41_STRAF|nr:ABC-2 type transporter family protein [Striga asiatica]